MAQGDLQVWASFQQLKHGRERETVRDSREGKAGAGARKALECRAKGLELCARSGRRLGALGQLKRRSEERC